MRNSSRLFVKLFILIAAIFISIQNLPLIESAAQGVTYSYPIITNNFTPDVIPSGGTSVLTVVLGNSNSFPVTLSSYPPAISEPLPSGVYFANPVNATSDCGITVTTIGTTLSLYGGVIPAADGDNPGTCTVKVNVTSTSAGSTFIYTIPASELVATDATGSINLTNQTKTDATIQVRTVQPPSLSKAFNPNTRTVGASSLMSITIRNNDLNYALHQVTLTDNLPSNLVIYSSPGTTFSNCGSSVSLTDASGGALGAGDTGIKLVNAEIPANSSCVVSVYVTSMTPGAYTNTIPANAIQSREGVTNATAASAQVNFQIMGLTKAFSVTNMQVGGTTKLTITLTNYSSTQAFTGVSLTDSFPTGLVPAAIPNLATTCGTGTVAYDSGSNSISLTDGTITANGSCTITVELTATEAGTFTNVIPAKAVVTTQGATNVTAVSASVTTYASGLGITSASKSFSPSSIALGGVSRLTITFTAPGDTALSNFSITDALPVGVVIAPTPNATKSTYCVGGTLTATAGGTQFIWSGGSIAASRSCSIAVNVTSSTPGTFTNIITPSNISNTEGRNMSSNISSTLYVSGISVAKAYAPTVVNINGVSQLTITLQNTNSSQIDFAAFADTLQSGVMIASPANAYTNCGSDAVLVATAGTRNISLSNATIPAQVGGVPGICTVVLDVVGVTTGSWSNTIAAGDLTGTIHGTSTKISNPTSASASLTVASLRINVNKSFSPNTVFGGSASTLTLTLSNPNNAVLTGVAFTDNFPAGMFIAAPASPTTTCGGTVVAVPNATSFSFSGGTIAANGVCYITVKTTMNVINTLTNTIPVGAVTTTNGASNAEKVEASLGNLSLATVKKVFFDSSIYAGESTTMQITISNKTNVELTGLGLVDALPENMSPVLPLTAIQCNGGTVSYDAASNTLYLTGGELPAYGSCLVTVEITSSVPANYQNCLDAGVVKDDQGVTNDSASCANLEVDTPVTVTPPSITKVFSADTIPADGTSLLTFTITNPNTTVALTGVEFTDELPAGMTLTSTPNPTQCNGVVSFDSSTNTLRLTGGSISAGGSCTVVAGVSAEPGVYDNTTSVVTSTNGGTGNSASDTLTVIAAPVISKEFNLDTIATGGISTLTFTISNPNPVANPVDLTGVKFTDVLPTGVTVAASPDVTVTGCGTAYTFAPSADGATLTFSGGVVAVGTDCVISVDVTAANGGTYVNTTGAVSSTNGGTGNTATDTLTVSGPGLSLVKTNITQSYNAVGNTVTYSYTVTNSGDVTISAPIMITDDHFPVPIICTSADLAIGESATCTANYVVTASDITAGLITNTAYASGDASGVTVTSNESSATVYYASLKLVKSTSTVSFHNAGNTITYTYTLINNGNITLYAPYVVYDDHFGTKLTCTSTAPLPVGGATTCTRTYTVVAADVTNRFVTNIAYATAADSGANTITSNTASVTVYKVDAPLITKAFAVDQIIAGATTTLTFTITNPTANVVPLTGVAFTDNLPAGMSVVTPILTSQCGGTVALSNSNTTIRLTGGSILANSSCTVTVDVTVNAGGTYVNTTGTVSSTNGGTGLTATDTLLAVAPPLISKAFSPITINDGGISTLTFTITNPSVNPIALTGVAFSDNFPTGLKVADPANVDLSGCGTGAVFTASAGDASVSLSGATVAVGTPCVISVDVTASAGVYANTTNKVTSTEGGDGIPSNTATLEVLSTLDLSINKTDGVKSVDRGEVVTYTITVSNDGLIDATGAKVVDSFPSLLEDISWTCVADTGASCTASGTGNISDTVNLPAGKKVIYTVIATVADDATTSIINSASVIPPVDLVDVNTDNNTEKDIDTLNRLSLTKLAAVEHTDYLVLGEEVTYTYTLTNNGTSTLSAPFTISDDQIGTPDKGTPFTCGTVTTLAPGESVTCTAAYSITQDDLDVGALTNTATGYALDADGNTVTSNEASQTIGADQEPMIGLAKEVVSIDTVSVGTYDVTFNIIVKNYGNVTLHDISVTDDLTATFTVAAGHEETVFSVVSINGDGVLDVNAGYDGVTDTELLDTGNTLAPNAEGVITIVVRVIPTTHYFENSVEGSGISPADAEVTDVSQNGDNPDIDGDLNPTNNNEPTPIEFGNGIFDPPTGIKTVDASGRPQVTWTMVWINNTNIVGVRAAISDPIPEDTVYQAVGASSGYDVPAGAPADSTNIGITCTSSAATVTEACYYEGPTATYPRGRIIWEGTIAPDFGITDPALAVNALHIVFNVRSSGMINHLENRATADVDLNGDGDYDDAGETGAVAVSKSWNVEVPAVPETGFAPYAKTYVPEQPKLKMYANLGDIWLEIPSLGVKIPIVGVPQTEDGWDVTWLDNQAGWLTGTAYPTLSGNSVLTAHVYNANGKPGPFINLTSLKYGDQIIIHAWGQEYVYEVREFTQITPDDTSLLTKHEDLPWLTLITCRGYDPATGEYRYRYVVRAVQVAIK